MGAINMRDVPDDLHRAIKAQAASEGKTIKHWLLELAQKKMTEKKCLKK